MSTTTDHLTGARERIRMTYDPDFFSSAGGKLIDLLSQHFERIQGSAGSVLNWQDPTINTRVATDFLDRGDQASWDESTSTTHMERFAGLVQTMLARGHNLHDPRYIGHQVPPSVPIAGLFDALGSITNQVSTIYEMGPWASAVEQATIEVLGAQVGLHKGEFAGFATSGGSLANLTALLSARNVALQDGWQKGMPRSGPQPVIVAHREAHYCVARAAGTMGLGTNNVFSAELDERHKMDPERLDASLKRLREQNRPIVAVVACACATPTGAFDPLNDIADVCQRHGVWLHVDAAHGGAACLSDRHRHLVAGLERADSFIWDAHKMLFVPALCAFVFYRDKQHRFDAFQQDAPYLFDPSAPGIAEYDGALKTLECTRRAAVYGLWGLWSLFGRQLFADLVDVTFEMGRIFYGKLREARDFEPLHEPECNIVVFRFVPDELRDATPELVGSFQLRLRRELIQSGEFYIVPTSYDGTPALRATIINPLTQDNHLDLLMKTIRDKGKLLLARQDPNGCH